MKLNLINGNNQEYTTETELLLCFYKPQTHFINHIEKQTRLKVFSANKIQYVFFKPKTSKQVVQLLTFASTYSWVISYSDNATDKNTLYFKAIERPLKFYQ